MTVEMIAAIRKVEDRLNGLRRMLNGAIPCGNAIWGDTLHPIHKTLAECKDAISELSELLGKVK